MPVDVEKFSEHGMVSKETFENRGLGSRSAEVLSRLANFGLSKNTWTGYSTVKYHIEGCQQETGVDLSLPFNLYKTLHLVAWMFDTRGLMGTTVDKYLSGVRMVHLSLGYDEPCLREPIIKLIVKGRKNWDAVNAKLIGKRGKSLVTITMMKLIKRKLHSVDWDQDIKRLFWAICCVAWSGSFRIHEDC